MGWPDSTHTDVLELICTAVRSGAAVCVRRSTPLLNSSVQGFLQRSKVSIYNFFFKRDAGVRVGFLRQRDTGSQNFFRTHTVFGATCTFLTFGIGTSVAGR